MHSRNGQGPDRRKVFGVTCVRAVSPCLTESVTLTHHFSFLVMPS
jgi:hypothetical protein